MLAAAQAADWSGATWLYVNSFWALQQGPAVKYSERQDVELITVTNCY